MNTTKKIKNIKLVLTGFCSIIFTCYILLSGTITIYSKASEAGGITTRSSQTLPGVLVLDDPETANSKFAGDKGKTPFDHNQHISQRAAISCVTCHHTNSNNLTVALEEQVAKCSTCHLAEDSTCQVEGTNEDKKFKGKNAINSKEAYHGNDNLVGCIGCHKTRNIEPIGCNSCHTGSTSVEYNLKPAFPTIKAQTKIQINQTNQNAQILTPAEPKWANNYGYSAAGHNNHPYYYHSYTPQTQHNERVIEREYNKEPKVEINNLLPNNLESRQAELVRVINNDYLLEDPNPRKIKATSLALTEEEEPQIASNKAPDPLIQKVGNQLQPLKEESYFDQALSLVNKVAIILIIGLYIDIRRRISS